MQQNQKKDDPSCQQTIQEPRKVEVGTTGNCCTDSYAWTARYNVNRGYGINGLNQMTTSGPAALGYDGRGNLITSGSNSLTYGPENMLATSNVGGTSRHLAYEGDGQAGPDHG